MNDDDFAKWFARDYRPLVAAITAICGSRRTAEEAVAEAFTKAYTRRGEFADLRSPSAWLYRVAANEVRMTWRRRLHERRWQHRQRPVVVEPADADPQLWDAVAALPLRQREVVALRYLASYTQEEIADVLGIAPGTVASTLHDARRALRHALTRTDRSNATTR